MRWSSPPEIHQASHEYRSKSMAIGAHPAGWVNGGQLEVRRVIDGELVVQCEDLELCGHAGAEGCGQSGDRSGQHGASSRQERIVAWFVA